LTGEEGLGSNYFVIMKEIGDSLAINYPFGYLTPVDSLFFVAYLSGVEIAGRRSYPKDDWTMKILGCVRFSRRFV
jgi:hypothetical protein